jgi:DNA modification methylase
VISRILCGDAHQQLRTLPAASVHCVVTSPPYLWLRDYGHEGQIGLEETLEEYVAKLGDVFDEVRRVLHPSGTLWLNLGDSYANDKKWGGSTGGYHSQELHGKNSIGRTKRRTGLKAKDRIGIPWMIAFELRKRGWYLRDEIIWAKKNPLPEAVTDRTVKGHEQIFLFAKSERYHFSHKAIQEPAAYDGRDLERVKGSPKYTTSPGGVAPGQAINTMHLKGGKRWQTDDEGNYVRNRRSVWWFPTSPCPEAHFATMPPAIVDLCLRAGCPREGTVLDPFTGSGTTGVVAASLGLDFLGIELNPEYVRMAERRIAEAIQKAETKPRLFNELGDENPSDLDKSEGESDPASLPTTERENSRMTDNSNRQPCLFDDREGEAA